MRYRRLGNTALDVSILGFGASPLGDAFGSIDPADGRRAVACALDHGITYFDVAPYYGRTLAETRLGESLQGHRNRVVLATKAGRYDLHPPEGFDFSAARLVRSLEESLRRLRTDVIDVFQLHDIEFADRRVILDEALPALARLKEQGKVRAIGITGYPLGLLRAVAEAFPVDTVLGYCHYDLLDTTLDTVLAPLARQRGFGLLSASPLHMRVLTRAGAPDWHPAPPEVRAAAREAAAWCDAHGVDLADLALRFALAYDGVATTLVGMSRAAEVEQNVAASGAAPDPEALAAVRAILRLVLDRSWPSGRPENNDLPV
jgi:L-galactose dehydrogenase